MEVTHWVAFIFGLFFSNGTRIILMAQNIIMVILLVINLVDNLIDTLGPNRRTFPQRADR